MKEELIYDEDGSLSKTVVYDDRGEVKETLIHSKDGQTLALSQDVMFQIDCKLASNPDSVANVWYGRRGIFWKFGGLMATMSPTLHPTSLRPAPI